MNADTLVDAYVADVVKRLPRAQRADVALELRSLLIESLEGREDVAAFLADFGRPAEVAARYGPPVTVIDPADSRRFLRLSAIGLVVIWVGGAFSAISPREWWEQYAVAALVWPGLLVLIFAAAAGVRRRWPATARWKPPRRAPRDPDRVSRVGMSFALAFFVAGTFVLVFGQSLLDQLTSGAPGVLTYDPVFARRIAPWLLTLMIAHLVFLGVLTVRGRWTPRLRQFDAGFGLAICAVMVWALVAGPVYTAPATDEAAKGISALIVLGSLASVAVTAWRGQLSVPHRA
jgi:hypothetical protein